MDEKFKKNFIKGSLITTVGTASSMVFHFLSIMIMTRQLSKEDFGIFALIVVIASLLNIISGFGLELSLVKFISSANELEKKSTFIPTLIIRISFIAAFTILLLLFGNSLLSLFSFTVTDFLFVIIVLFVLINIRTLFYNLLQGMNRFKKYATIQIVTSVLRVVFLLIIILIDVLTLMNVIYVEIGIVVLAVILQLAFIPYKEIFHWNMMVTHVKKIIKFSIPLYINSIVTFIYNQVNIFIIGAYLNPVSVASYDVAGKIPAAGRRGFNSFIIVFFPNISKLFSKGERDAALTLMNKSLLTFSTLINLLVLISFLFNKEIIFLLFSDKYIDSVLAFSFLMVAFYMNAMSNIMGYSLVSAGFPAITLRVGIIASIISLVGALIMVPIWGIMGAVYSLILVRFSSVLFHNLYLNKYKMKIELTNLIKPSLITLVALLLYYQFIPEGQILKGVFIIVYLIAVYFLLPGARETFNQIASHLFKQKSENKVN